MSKCVFEGYIVGSGCAEDFIEYYNCKWESQDIDDSYHMQNYPLYDKPFKSCKKIRVTVEEVGDE